MEEKVEAKSVNFEWKELFKTDVSIHFRVICKIMLLSGIEVTGSAHCIINKGEQGTAPYFTNNKVSQAENDAYHQANQILFNISGRRLFPPVLSTLANLSAYSNQLSPNPYQGT
ncbi:hypothetical protein [Rahnella variigena]|uniref:hypothetical protein n=1 Tax=Rahnella variigena TaxID=574964 RepID=UPI0013302A6E|nr:hypothetical protein [Rahnella variigena]